MQNGKCLAKVERSRSAQYLSHACNVEQLLMLFVLHEECSLEMFEKLEFSLMVGIASYHVKYCVQNFHVKVFELQ